MPDWSLLVSPEVEGRCAWVQILPWASPECQKEPVYVVEAARYRDHPSALACAEHAALFRELHPELIHRMYLPAKETSHE